MFDKKVRIGFAMSGSFCTFEKVFKTVETLVRDGAEIIPVMSFNASQISSRFGTAEENVKRFEEITGRKVIKTIEDAEPIGPKDMCDIMVVAPATANSIAKLALGITDTPVVTKRKHF